MGKKKSLKTVQSGTAKLLPRKDGGHKWIIQLDGRVVSASTSSSSVTTIAKIGSELAPALKSLAKK